MEDFIMNISERQKDFLSVIEKLDISPTQFKNAQSKYEALAAFLDEHGIEATIIHRAHLH